MIHRLNRQASLGTWGSFDSRQSIDYSPQIRLLPPNDRNQETTRQKPGKIALPLDESLIQRWKPGVFCPAVSTTKTGRSMKLYIKNMVCIRCKMVVKAELGKLGIEFTTVELGEADITTPFSKDLHDQLRDALLCSGLELMDNRKSVMIQRIKNVIIELVHYSEEPLIVNFSVYLSEKLQHDYTYMANLFSEVTGTTIEKFIIAHKIERVKELLVYDELNLTEIAYQMHYSSVAHLSAQFKKTTGLTPSHFKKLKDKRRRMLEDV